MHVLVGRFFTTDTVGLISDVKIYLRNHFVSILQVKSIKINVDTIIGDMQSHTHCPAQLLGSLEMNGCKVTRSSRAMKEGTTLQREQSNGMEIQS